MAISSQGIGSGLDVNSIVTQLVAIERQPLQQLNAKASTLQSQLSLYGTLKSQASALGDAAAALASTTQWNTQKASSSNTAVGVTVGTAATAQSLSVEVSQLARAQSAASSAVVAGAGVGAAGTLTLQLGTWAGAAAALGFTANASASVNITVAATDTMSGIAAKINAASAGVTATVLRDGANERLVMRSSATGADAGFAVTTAGDPGLAMFAVTGTIDSTNPTPASGMFMSQTALNAVVKINGVDVQSASNTMTNVVTGVSLQLAQVTTSPVNIKVENDLDTVTKNVQSLVDAYNALGKTLADATKYDAASKKGGLLQGDSVTVGLQNALRSMVGSASVGSTFTRLSEVGVERQTDGSLKLNTTKLNSATADLANLKSLFVADNGDASTNGFGLKIRDFSRGLVAADGRVTNKTAGLQSAITRNSTEQDRVNTRASRVETDLRRQYTALDAQMAQLTGLGSFVTAQLAQWNKSSN